MCLVAFQKMFRKIFSDVWLCSWKYHRKHIFYLLLTFSHIFSVTKRIHNIIHSSKQKQNPEKNHQIRTNEGEIAISIGEIAIGAIAIGEIAISEIAIAIDADRGGADDHAVVFGTLTDRRLVRRCDRRLDRSLSLSRCVCSLSVFCCVLFVKCVSLFCTCYEKCLKVKRFRKMIFGSTSANFGQTKIIFRKIYFS